MRRILLAIDGQPGGFKDGEMGSGVPVLGRLLHAETLVDPLVLGRGRVVFTAGTWTGSVRVRTTDVFGGDRAPFVPLVA